MLSWQYYKNRKSLNVKMFLENNEIKTYEHFCNYLKTIGVVPPSKDDAPQFEADKPKKPKPKPAAPKKAAAPNTVTVSKPSPRRSAKKPSVKSSLVNKSKPSIALDEANDLDKSTSS